MRATVAFLLVLASSFTALGQGVLQRKVTGEWEQASCRQVLEDLRVQTKVNFIYGHSYLPDTTYSFAFRSATLGHVLKQVLEGTCLEYLVLGNEIVLRKKEEERYTLSGKVVDAVTGEELTGVAIFARKLKKGTVTNIFGLFSLTLPAGDYLLEVSSIGYQTRQLEVALKVEQRLDLQLQPTDLQLEEVLVTGNREETYVEQLQVHSLKLSPELTRQVPAFLGEADVVKTLQLLPGVQSGSEGNAGFFVRGGGADQNLVLIDGAPVFSSSHFGFFSVFNPDIVKSIEFSRGSIPAHFGGRLSSVLSVNMREGNQQNFSFSGGIGSLSTRATVEGPLLKGKASFLLSGRRTYADLLFNSLPNDDLAVNRLYFYDLNAKLDYRPDQNNRLSLSLYNGRDQLGYKDFFNTSWGNQAGSLRWSHIFNPRIFSNLTLYTSYFRARSTVNLQEAFSYFTRYNLRNIGLKQIFNYYPGPDLELDFGVEFNYHRFFYGEIQPLAPNSIVQEEALQPGYAVESAVFGSMDLNLTDRLKAYAGLRYSRFDNLGPARVNLYNIPDGSSGFEEAFIVDSLLYRSGEIVNTWEGLEPRLALRYLVASSTSLKASYSKTRQYINQLSNTNTPSPVDMWAPANRYIRPQIGDQFSLGVFKSFMDGKVEGSLEGYYKLMQNQTEFKPLASLVLNNNLETELLQGNGTSYGVELLLRKLKGKTTGWVSYTLSRSELEVNGINFNRPYPASFDRRHNMAVVLNYRANPQLQVAANWVYSSGVAYTFPVGKYEKNGLLVPFYTSRNDFRLPPVHRLDLSVTFFRKMKPDSKNESSFNFSVYNAYYRKNTYAYIFRQSRADSSRTEVVKLYLFAIIPSFTYNFKF